MASIRASFLVAVTLGTACFAEVGDRLDADEGSTTSGCEPGTLECACRDDSTCDAPGTCIAEICEGPVQSPDTSDDGMTQTSAPVDSSDDSTTEVSGCGDGVLDPDEECDDEFGCVDCTLEHYTCNPLNQAGCAATQTCDLLLGATLADQRTACFQDGRALAGAACEYNGLSPDLQCADGLSCVAGGYVPGCTAAGCCTPWCDLADPTAVPCVDGAECLTWKEPEMPPGLDTIGLCIAL